MGKALNFNEGKPRPSLILQDMPKGFNECLKVREFGISKGYDRMNFAESIGTEDAKEWLEDNIDSMYRHLIALEDGPLDESKCHHLAHVAVRAMMAIEYYYS